jgi:ABC-type sugar transport system ATPase subunit
MANLLEMKNISKSFYGVKVLSGVGFNVGRGEVVALCGENGAGKSTLMKILAAIYKSEEGDIFLDGEHLPPHLQTLDMQKRGVSMIHQELNLMEQLTVAQNIFLTREPLSKNGLINFKKMNADAKKLLLSLGQSTINPTDMVGSLKTAQKQMVEIAKAISFNVKVLIMDEPTAMLTQKETDILFDLIRKLAKEGIGIIYISHRLKEIKEVCDRVTILRDGLFIATKPILEVSEQQIANYMVGREVSVSHATDFNGDPNDIILEVKHVSDALLKDVSFKVTRGEIVGFSGLVGSGRSELMEFIFGIRKPKSGEVYLNGKQVVNKVPAKAIKRGIGFVTEDRQKSGVVINRNIRENINLIDQVKNKGFFNSARKQKANTASMIDRLNIKCAGQTQLVSNLSGGNQQKVVLGKWLLVGSDILILDEPTRGIDVGAREEIYRIIHELSASGKTIILVSSDLTEVLNICQRIIVMHEGAIKGELTHDDRTEEIIMSYATNAS